MFRINCFLNITNHLVRNSIKSKKIMKNYIYIVSIVILCLTISCESENDKDILSTQIESVENSYRDELFKESELSTEIQKETTAEESELRAYIAQVLEDSYSKTTTYLKSSDEPTDFYAVFKYGSCYNNQELRLAMDCQDGVFARTKAIGDIGDSYVSSNKNAHLVFCMVNAKFTLTQSKYAVLNLTADIPAGAEAYWVFHDNENDNNANHVYIDGVDQPLPWNSNPDFRKKHRETTMGSNTTLFWIYFNGTGSQNNYPSCGLNTYGTLGDFCSTDGTIGIDDENNRSQTTTGVWSSNTALNAAWDPECVIPGIMHIGRAYSEYYLTF